VGPGLADHLGQAEVVQAVEGAKRRKSRRDYLSQSLSIKYLMIFPMTIEIF